MTVVAVMSSTADSSFLILSFSLLVEILTNLSSLRPSVLSLEASSPLLCYRTKTVLTLYYLNPLYFLTARKQKCFHEEEEKKKISRCA